MSLRSHTTPTAPGLQLAVAVVALGALSMASGCRGNKASEPPVHLQQNMDFSQSFEAQEKNEWFPDKRAMRPPVQGTQARSLSGAANDGFLKEDDHLYKGRGPNGRLVDALPRGIALTPELLERGQNRYNIFCVPCHDSTGAGNGMVMRRGWPNKPPSYHEARTRALPLGHFYDVITNGRGTMKGYAAQLTNVRDRWAVAAYVRALQLSNNAKIADVPAGVARQKGWLK